MAWTTPATVVAGQLMTAAFWNTHVRDNELYLFTALYPVGSLYFNAVNGTNPGTLLGFGTWAAYCVGRVPVGLDATQGEFQFAEMTGGFKTHTLTVAELAAHTHSEVTVGWSSGVTATGGPEAGNFGSVGTATGSTGGGTAHNNLQPYQTVYIWKRTA